MSRPSCSKQNWPHMQRVCNHLDHIQRNVCSVEVWEHEKVGFTFQTRVRENAVAKGLREC